MAPRKKPQSTRDREHRIQCGIITECRLNETYPELSEVYAIPNGGLRHIREAVKIKMEGGRPGVPDLCLDVPRGPYHGLKLEVKTPDGKVSKDQIQFMDQARARGYYCAVAYSVKEALEVLESYMALGLFNPKNDGLPVVGV